VKKILFNILLTAFLFFNIVAEASNLNVFSIGYFDFNKQKNEAVDIRFEKRLDKEIFDLGPEEEPLYYIKPFYGIEITTDSAVYGIGGIFIEEKISKNFFLTPSFGIGAFSKGNGKDLGHEIEFRSTLEISYKLKNKNRIGLSIGHISNAGIGDTNPGAEILSLSYQVSY
tara:strand:- start:71 stop:580 length:510 start_codon:yes stop_codon:yes gene_type:complete